LEKLKLKSYKHEKNRLVIIIEKSSNLQNFLAMLLDKCNFGDNLYKKFYTVEGVKIHLLKDTEDHYVNKNFDIDIIYGNRSVIIIIRIKKENSKNIIMNFVTEYCNFDKVIGQNNS